LFGINDFDMGISVRTRMHTAIIFQDLGMRNFSVVSDLPQNCGKHKVKRNAARLLDFSLLGVLCIIIVCVVSISRQYTNCTLKKFLGETKIKNGQRSSALQKMCFAQTAHLCFSTLEYYCCFFVTLILMSGLPDPVFKSEKNTFSFSCRLSQKLH